MADRPDNPERYRLTLQATGPGPPAAIRLRAALKHLLRSHGLKYVAVEEVPAPDSRAEPEGGHKP